MQEKENYLEINFETGGKFYVLCGGEEAFLKSVIIYEMNCILRGIKEIKWFEIEAGAAFNLSLSTQRIGWFYLKTGHFSLGIS